MSIHSVHSVESFNDFTRIELKRGELWFGIINFIRNEVIACGSANKTLMTHLC